MSQEPEILVHNREQLIYLLTEAAEIEHGLMCCYLYAAFSLKTTDDSGLTPEQLAATRRWRATIMDVAIEEMLHLGLVANLMSAIGATPHFSRPNFPVSAGYHPSGVVVELAPFSRETMDHFVYLERPEGVELADGGGFGAMSGYQRATRSDILVPSAQDFLTVGHLYRAIGQGLDVLARKHGEAELFLGARDVQPSAASTGFDKLIQVTDLQSATRAIEAIVEQGEGTPGHVENSHYARFCRVRDELAELTTAEAGFRPSWPCERNPVMRKPPVPEGKIHVAAPEAARLLDVGNAAYAVMLRCLMAVFGQKLPSDTERAKLFGMSIDLMHAIVPVAERLARVPATADPAGPTAGLTFTLSRSVTAVADPTVSLAIITERVHELAAACTAASGALPVLARPAGDFNRIAGLFPAVVKTRSTDGEPAPAAPAKSQQPPPPQETVQQGNGQVATTDVPGGTNAAIEIARGQNVVIRFEGKRCIHARFCVLQAPTVFKANTPGAWIFPDTMDAERLVGVAEACPSGAITYQRMDGRPGEPAPPVNLARIRENGPYGIAGDIRLGDAASLRRATLCRCGASKNKPFCDGAHVEAGFAASGEPATRTSQPLSSRDGTLEVKPLRNGPLQVSGNLEICSGTGRTIDRVTSARLCRCGASAAKPFCDGSHFRVGFIAD